MPIYDLTCPNRHEQRNLLLKMGERPPCPECGEPTSMLWKSSAAVIQDSIEGGIYIRNGICNPDGSPRRFDSKSEMAREAKRSGWTNYVQHQPPPGTDKSKMTTRWI